MPGSKNGTELAIVSNARHEKKAPNAKKPSPTLSKLKDRLFTETALKFMFLSLLPSFYDRQVENDRNCSEQNAADNCPCLELLFQCSALSLAVV